MCATALKLILGSAGYGLLKTQPDFSIFGDESLHQIGTLDANVHPPQERANSFWSRRLMVCNLPNDNRETTPIREAADGRDDMNKPINGITCCDLTNPRAFAKWLIQYRNRLSMMIDAETAERGFISVSPTNRELR